MFSAQLILNIFVGVILFIYWLVAFIVLYHLLRFGIGTQPKRFAAVFLLGSLFFSGLVIVFSQTLDISSLLSQ